jgi:two-component system CheB/CheR fusion protein
LEGAHVDAARSGAEALERLRSGTYDILLSDIGMPGMDGFELIRQVRASDRAAGLLAVALTGFGRPKDEKMALEAGFDARLGKPVSLNALLDVLSRLAMEASDVGRRPPPPES